MRLKHLTYAVAMGTWIAASGPALAWQPIAKCGGSPVPRESPFDIFRLRCTIPDGSPAAGAYFNALDQWAPANMIRSRMVVDGVCQTVRDDGFNDVAVIPRSVLGPGRDGTAIHVISTCWPIFGGAKLKETDVRIADDLDFREFGEDEDDSAPDPDPGAAHGRHVFAHEIGHAHALGHTWAPPFSIMKTFEPYPLVGGTATHHQIFGDDLLGARVTTFAGITVFKNLFVSPQHWNGSDIAPLMSKGTAFVCGGQSIRVAFTVGDNGLDVNTANNVEINIGLSAFDPPTGYFNHAVVHTENIGSIGRASERTISRDIMVPFGLLGRHRIYMSVDPGNVFGERSEDDNIAVSPTVLNVVC
jgi:hypothetical protein